MGQEVELAEESYGPAMRACTVLQRRFVIALLSQGTANFTQASVEAGYQGDARTHSVNGHHLAHNPKIQEAMHEEAKRRLHAGVIPAISTLVEVATDKFHKDRVKAAGMILNRVGLHEMTEHKVTVENVSDSAMVERITALSAKLGLDPKKLLGNVAMKAEKKAVDAEFEEVGTTGLEDVL